MAGGDRRTFFRALAGASGVVALTAEAMAKPAAPGSPRLHDVSQFGAVGDGRTDATAGLQRAVDACAAAGGGLVLVPPGRYLSGAVNLRSHVHLHLGSGATLLASQRPEDYPAMAGRWEGIERTTHSSLLTGVDLEDVTISGTGTIEGRGEPWWKAHDDTVKLRTARQLNRQADNPPDAPLRWPRPRLINLVRCQRVLVSGIHTRNSPSYNLHFIYCQDVVVEGVTVDSMKGPNSDGVVLDSSRRVRVTGCSLSTRSDGIALKSGYNDDGRRVHIACEDVIISSCHLYGTMGGGITIGSETAGDIRDVSISNCLISGGRMGIHVRSPRGRGGTVERVRVSNVIMREISSSAIALSNYYDSLRLDPEGPRAAVDATSLKDVFERPLAESERNPPLPSRGNPETDRSMVLPVGPGTPSLRDFSFNGVSVDQVQALAVLEGLPERFIRGVTMTDLNVSRARTGLFCWRVGQVRLSGATFERCEGLAVTAQDVERLEINRLAAGSAGHRTVVQLENVNGAFIHGCSLGQSGPQFLRQVGDTNRGIVADGNDLGEES
jgi:hypothetical protein